LSLDVITLTAIFISLVVFLYATSAGRAIVHLFVEE